MGLSRVSARPRHARTCPASPSGHIPIVLFFILFFLFFVFVFSFSTFLFVSSRPALVCAVAARSLLFARQRLWLDAAPRRLALAPANSSVRFFTLGTVELTVHFCRTSELFRWFTLLVRLIKNGGEKGLPAGLEMTRSLWRSQLAPAKGAEVTSQVETYFLMLLLSSSLFAFF